MWTHATRLKRPALRKHEKKRLKIRIEFNRTGSGHKLIFETRNFLHDLLFV